MLLQTVVYYLVSEMNEARYSEDFPHNSEKTQDVKARYAITHSVKFKVTTFDSLIHSTMFRYSLSLHYWRDFEFVVSAGY